MKKNVFLVSVALLCSTLLLADGAKDIQYSLGKPRIDSSTKDAQGNVIYKLVRDASGNIEYDTFGKCDEQYFSAIELTITRPEAVKFTVGTNKTVEFSKGNLQYCAATNTFRFADNQWSIVGDGSQTTYPVVYWDSLKHQVDASGNWVWIKAVDGVTDSCYAYDTVKTISRNQFVGKNYGGWIDLFGWGTSGLDLAKIPNKVNADDAENNARMPYVIGNVNYDGTSHANNLTGYGPSGNSINIAGLAGTTVGFSVSEGACRFYDWGQYNDIYCKWVGYDTITDKTTGTLKDTAIYDSTMFHATELSTSGKQDSFVFLWRTLTKEEWTFLLGNDRSAFCAWTNAEIEVDPKVATQKVKGMLIFPDGWQMSKAKADKQVEPYTGTDLTPKSAAYQSVNYNNWKALESTGVVFLPAAGRRDYKTFDQYQANGNYWTASANAVNTAASISFDASKTTPQTVVDVKRQYGYSVRLVHDLVEDANGKSTSIFFKTVHDLSKNNSIWKTHNP